MQRALSSIPPGPQPSADHASVEEACASGRRTSASGMLPRLPGRALLLHGLTVLVVDGDEDSREMVVEYVAMHGAKAIATSSVAEALVVLGGFQVDVVVVDRTVPDDIGPGLVERMEMHPTWRDIGCVVVGCDAPSDSMRDGTRRVVELRKPFELDRIVTAVIEVGSI